MVAERGSQAAGQVNELKVSGHSMKLDPGLYCVFSAPDSPVPDSRTGLPGVRISESPGQQPGAVAIVGFKPNGWIGPDTAAMVQVSEAAAEILVTVYQDPNGKADAPKLQVVRLSADPAAASQPAAPPARQPAATARPSEPERVEVMAHIYGRGDVGGRMSDWMGEPGSNRWIEGFAVAPAGLPPSDIEYQAVLGRGWLSPWAEGGQYCGSRGMSLPILGLRVKLRGPSAETHRVQVVASFVDGTRVGPIHDGDACEAPSLAALEAFQLAIIPAEAARLSPAPRPARAKATKEPAAPPPAPPPATPARRTAQAKPVAPAPAKASAPAKAPTKAPAKAAAKPPVPPAPPKPANRKAPARRAPATRRP